MTPPFRKTTTQGAFASGRVSTMIRTNSGSVSGYQFQRSQWSRIGAICSKLVRTSTEVATSFGKGGPPPWYSPKTGALVGTVMTKQELPELASLFHRGGARSK